jgi:hypothetical protein
VLVSHVNQETGPASLIKVSSDGHDAVGHARPQEPAAFQTLAVFVAVATIAGSLAATPASAQRGKYAGASPTGYHPGPGRYDFGDCE